MDNSGKEMWKGKVEGLYLYIVFTLLLDGGVLYDFNT